MLRQFLDALNDCPIKEVRSVYFESLKAFLRSMRINSGGWASVVLPIYCIVKLISLIQYLFAQVDQGMALEVGFERQASRILETPEPMFARTFSEAY